MDGAVEFTLGGELSPIYACWSKEGALTFKFDSKGYRHQRWTELGSPSLDGWTEPKAPDADLDDGQRSSAS